MNSLVNECILLYVVIGFMTHISRHPPGIIMTMGMMITALPLIHTGKLAATSLLAYLRTSGLLQSTLKLIRLGYRFMQLQAQHAITELPFSSADLFSA